MGRLTIHEISYPKFYQPHLQGSDCSFPLLRLHPAFRWIVCFTVVAFATLPFHPSFTLPSPFRSFSHLTITSLSPSVNIILTSEMSALVIAFVPSIICALIALIRSIGSAFMNIQHQESSNSNLEAQLGLKILQLSQQLKTESSQLNRRLEGFLVSEKNTSVAFVGTPK